MAASVVPTGKRLCRERPGAFFVPVRNYFIDFSQWLVADLAFGVLEKSRQILYHSAHLSRRVPAIARYLQQTGSPTDYFCSDDNVREITR
ncbi:MAG: hypothetical protein ACQETO_09155 [Pseudomonadota bacterium]